MTGIDLLTKLATLFFLTLLGSPVLADGPGDIVTHSVPSTALGRSIEVAIYQPSDPPPIGGWPVLYLLHGLGGDATSWPKLGDIDATLDRLIAAGQLTPLIVVMPDAGNSWYVDSASVGGPGAYETALTRDLPNWIEASFPARIDRGGRAVAGLSMGGYGALRVALAQPSRYVAVAALSPAIWQNVADVELDLPVDQITLLATTRYFDRADPSTVLTDRDIPPPGKHFGTAFGTPFNARFFNKVNVFTLLPNTASGNDAYPAIYLTVGDDDSHKLWRGAIALYDTLQEDQRPVEMRITDGDHVWSLWKVSIVDALKFINSKLSGTP